ncbi:hypothetical protein G9A89_012028 [Geosiphon pyriformis]|nr:hypothetical protein G9A89_012028 [Geosiphon pyriformis]
MLKAIPYFLQGTAGEWFENLEEPFENWQAFKDAFLQQFTNNNTSITLRNCFHNIKQETSKSVMTYLGRFNKLLRQIQQLETNDYYSDAQILDQFIAGLKDKLIKKVRPHAPADLATAIRQAKSYEMAMEEANHTKLVNLAIGETSSAAEKKIDQLTKKILTPTMTQPKQFWIIIQQPISKLSLLWNSRTLETRLPQNQNSYYSPAPQSMQQQYQQPLPIQPYQTPPTQQYQVPARRLVQHNQFTPQNQLQNNHNRINLNNQLVPQNSGQQRPNHYYTQPSYLTIPEESDFQQTTLSEGEIAAPRSNSFNHTIPSAQIAQNVNLSDIFPFEFEANESPFLLSNAAVNEQKAITVIYTEATVEEKPIRLILDSGSAGSIITYQLMQQLKRNINRPAQTVIVTADGMKKTSVGEIDDFPFSIDGITIPVKVLVMDAPQYQALVRNDWLLKANANLNWKTQELKISYQGQYTIDNTPCLTCGEILPEECNWIDVALRGEVCDQTCQYALSISKKVRKKTPFDAAYNSALNKLYHYPHDAEMIFDLAITLINGATQEDVRQMKEAEYIEYTIELAGFDYEDEVETYHQIASHTYPTKEAQIQRLEQMNIQLCEEYVMSCDDQWCLECYALSISLPDENDKNEIEFEVSEQIKELPTTPIYLLKKQPPLQLKYFDNHGQGIRPEKAHEIDAGYDLRYPGKDTLILQPKFLTKINLKIALKIPPGAMVQIVSRSSLASKEINIRGGVIDAGYTGDITIMLQNETDKPFKIEHAEKIAQAIYLLLINISGLQSVNNREQLGKSERETQEIGIIHSNIFQDENPQIVSNFIEIIKHTLLPNPNIIPTTENYHLLEKKLSRINMGLLEPQQQRQLKQLIAEFADIFAKDNNDLGKTDIV